VPGFRRLFVFSTIFSLFFSKITLFLGNNRETGSYLTAHTTTQSSQTADFHVNCKEAVSAGILDAHF
jgi:hypothetical protein